MPLQSPRVLYRLVDLVIKENLKMVKKWVSYTELNFFDDISIHHPISTHPGLRYIKIATECLRTPGGGNWDDYKLQSEVE